MSTHTNTKTWQRCFHAPPTECVYVFTKLKGWFRYLLIVFMAAKPLNAILQQNGLPTTLNFITRSRDNTESLSLAEDMQSQHCLKVVQVLNRQELQNDTTFSNLTGNQREEKKNVSLSLH